MRRGSSSPERMRVDGRQAGQIIKLVCLYSLQCIRLADQLSLAPGCCLSESSAPVATSSSYFGRGMSRSNQRGPLHQLHSRYRSRRTRRDSAPYAWVVRPYEIPPSRETGSNRAGSMDPRSVMVSLRTWKSLTRPIVRDACVSSCPCIVATFEAPRMTTPVTLFGSVGDLIWTRAKRRQSVSAETMHGPAHIVKVLCRVIACQP